MNAVISTNSDLVGVTEDKKTNTVDPSLITDNWVSCDVCEKWRKMPHGAAVPDEDVPWCCSAIGLDCASPSVWSEDAATLTVTMTLTLTYSSI